MSQGSLENSGLEEKGLDHYVTLITNGEDEGIEEVIVYLKKNPQNIQEVVQLVSDQYPGQPLPVAVRLGILIEKLVQ
jgi:hypothetical protein